MKDESIESLLENLKQTLTEKDKSIKQNTEAKDAKDPRQNRNFGDTFSKPSQDSVFVLKNKEDSGSSDNKDLLKQNILSHIETEVVRFIVDFCASDDGMSYIKLLIAKTLKEQEEFIKKMIKAEISEKIQQILSSKEV